MTALQVTAVLIRLLAIWCAVDSLAWVLALLDPLQAKFPGPALIAGHVVLYAVAAVVLWVFPAHIARKVLISPDPKSASLPHSKTLLNVAVVAAGLLVVAQALPEALSAMVILAESSTYDGALTHNRATLLARLAISLLHPILGLVLVLRAPSVTRWLWPRIEESPAGDA